MNNRFYNKSFVSVSDLTAGDLGYLFDKADEMKKLVEERGGDDRLKGKIMAALFYEPSSRTFSSFITAMQRLGGGVIPLNGMNNTSVAKGESLEDTAKVFSSYADIIVLRHNAVGSAKTMAKSGYVPVVNAGDGIGEHPTQAILDAYTISKHFKDFKNLTVGLIGDLRYGRTVHSLSQVLNTLGVRNFIFISPDSLKMPDEITQKLKRQKAKIIETTDIFTDYLENFDVIYITRVQKERFSDLTDFDKVKNSYIFNVITLAKIKQNSVIMHPLPRVNEIHPSVDDDRRALYFKEQMKYGMYVRMALIDAILRE